MTCKWTTRLLGCHEPALEGLDIPKGNRAHDRTVNENRRLGWTVATVNQMLDTYQAMTASLSEFSRGQIRTESALIAE